MVIRRHPGAMNSNSKESVNHHSSYTRSPHWLLDKGVSGNALRLYVALGKYADNKTGKAWPSRRALMADLGASKDAVKKWTQELVDLGALKVEERRRKDAPNKSNMYTLIYEPDARTVAADPPSREVESGQGEGGQSSPLGGIAITPELDPLELTSTFFHDQLPLADRDASAPSTPSEGSTTSRPPQDLDGPPRKRVRDALVAVGKAISDDDAHDFHAPAAQQAWEHFHDVLEKETGHLDYADALLGLVRERWTVTGEVAAPYDAGTELSKMLRSAASAARRHLRAV